MYIYKAHLTHEGILEIFSIKSSLNLGVNSELKVNFPDLVPALRPVVDKLADLDGDWVAGFVSGDGSFLANFTKPTSGKQSYVVSLEFKVTQHERDKELLNSLISFFGCGSLQNKGGKFPAWDYRCRKFQDITSKIIVFFN